MIILIRIKKPELKKFGFFVFNTFFNIHEYSLGVTSGLQPRPLSGSNIGWGFESLYSCRKCSLTCWFLWEDGRVVKSPSSEYSTILYSSGLGLTSVSSGVQILLFPPNASMAERFMLPPFKRRRSEFDSH